MLEIAPSLEARALQVDEGLWVTPLVRLGDQQAGRAAGRARAQPPGLDQEDFAEPRFGAGGGDGHAQDAAANDEDVRAARDDAVVRAPEHDPLTGGELVKPDGAVDGHENILVDRPRCGVLRLASGEPAGSPTVARMAGRAETSGRGDSEWLPRRAPRTKSAEAGSLSREASVVDHCWSREALGRWVPVRRSP